MQQATVQVSPNEAPVGADFAMNEQLAKDWKEMEERVQRLAELSRGQAYDKNIQKHQVIANLERVQAKTKKKADSTWGKFKHCLSNTLTVISNVGGMIADAASQVSFLHPIEKMQECATEPKVGFCPCWAML